MSHSASPRPRNRSRHRRCFPRQHYRCYPCCRYPHCRFRHWDSSCFHLRDCYCRWFHFQCCRLSRSPSFRSGSSYSFRSGSRYLDCLDWHCSHSQSNLFPFARGPSADCPSGPGFRFLVVPPFWDPLPCVLPAVPVPCCACPPVAPPPVAPPAVPPAWPIAATPDIAHAAANTIRDRLIVKFVSSLASCTTN